MKQRTFAVLAFKIIDASQADKDKVRNLLASNQKALAAIVDISDLDKQPDLMHTEAILVSRGMNANDDGFLHDELWNARNTPIMKPMNWQHSDKDIIGVIYSAEAYDFDGKLLTEKPKDDVPYEIKIKGAIWHYLPHLTERAKEIASRATAGDLFVSMECWFDSYDYLVEENGQIYDIIHRVDETAYLDHHLRVSGGTGFFNKRRIGRALKGIVFGGMGFVDKPANSRSLITDIKTFAKKGQVLSENSVLEEILLESSNAHLNKEDVNMNDVKPTGGHEIEGAVEKALAKRDHAEAHSRALASVARLETEKSSLEAQVRSKDVEIAQATALVKTAHGLVDELVANIAKAGATNSTPEEIAKIDRAYTGEEKFRAKIAWIADSLRQSRASADVKELESLRAENKALKASVRKGQVTKLLANLFDQKDIDTLVAKAVDLNDADYKSWLDEKTLFANKMEEKMKKEAKEEEKEEKEEAEASRKGKGGVLAPQDGAENIDMHGVQLEKQGGKKGVPSSVPNRFKIAGSEMDIDAVVDEITEADLSGASAGKGETNERPMQALVASIFDKKDSKKEGGK